MYVKIFNRILDSSLADNPKLRHFFIDLLLCADPDGNIIMTKRAIAHRIRATEEEVEWALGELQKPDNESLTPDRHGRRIEPLPGHGYGWRVVNFRAYHDLKTANDLRAATAERVRRHREKHKKGGTPLTNEGAANKAEEDGDYDLSDRLKAETRDSGGPT